MVRPRTWRYLHEQLRDGLCETTDNLYLSPAVHSGTVLCTGDSEGQILYLVLPYCESLCKSDFPGSLLSRMIFMKTNYADYIDWLVHPFIDSFIHSTVFLSIILDQGIL